MPLKKKPTVNKKTLLFGHEFYNTFLKSCTESVKGSKRFKQTSYERVIKLKSNTELNLPVVCKDFFLKPTLQIHPEAVPFIFTVGGCTRNLLFYLLLKEINFKTGEYAFNKLTVEHFREFCKKTSNIDFSIDTIKQAHQELSEKNLTLNISRGYYQINPLIAGGKSDASRRELLNKYSLRLISKRRDPLTDLYPVVKGI